MVYEITRRLVLLSTTRKRDPVEVAAAGPRNTQVEGQPKSRQGTYVGTLQEDLKQSHRLLVCAWAPMEIACRFCKEMHLL